MDCGMTYELFLALLGFAFVTSVTPGPNNMMLLASGVNFGLRRTVPHMLGISVGHSVMVFLVGLGVAGVFLAHPFALMALKAAAVGYMLWLAWKIAHATNLAGAPGEGRAAGPWDPKRFREGRPQQQQQQYSAQQNATSATRPEL
jgi:threonine/homoserine/homoserine lactone efflux protein